jgi:hypothetical protein
MASRWTAAALAYGWEAANEMTPPMGPGDQSVPAPPLPYGTSISHRGVIGADGHVTPLPTCGAADEPLFYGGYEVSLAGGTVAYLCRGAPPGGQASPVGTLPSYLALSAVATPGAAAQTIADPGGVFQLSGDYLAYAAGAQPLAPGRIVVENRQTATVSYEVPLAANADFPTIALQADGTLVLLGAGTSACAAPSVRSEASRPAEWFSPASPVAHQLGCFYDGSLRPVDGQWVALGPGPGAEASLELVSLATASSRTLAVLPNAGMFEPQSQPQPEPQISAGPDFDGHQLAWVQQTCAGAAVQFTPDVSAMSPGPLPSTRCPVLFRVHGPLRPGAHGILRVRLSCPLGCTIVGMRISGSRVLSQDAPVYFSLPASAAPVTKSLRLSRRQLAYLRRHGRVRVVLSAEAAGLGSAPITKSAVRVTLAR